MNTRHSLTRDPCFARDGTLGGETPAPFIHASPSGSHWQGEGDNLSPEQFAAAVTPFPAGAIDRGGSSPAATVVTIDTESEPGSWADAIAYKFRDRPITAAELSAQIERDCLARKQARLARRAL